MEIFPVQGDRKYCDCKIFKIFSEFLEAKIVPNWYPTFRVL